MIGFETDAACDLPGVTCHAVTGFPVAGVIVAGVIVALFVGPRAIRRYRRRGWHYNGDTWLHCGRPAWSDDDGVECCKCGAVSGWDD